MQGQASSFALGDDIRNTRRDSGVVLLTVVLVIALLGVLVMQYNYLSGLDVMMAAGARDSTEAFFLAQAGLNQAIAVLEEDKIYDLEKPATPDADGAIRGSVNEEEEEKGWDSLDEDWAGPQEFNSLGEENSGQNVRRGFIFKIVDEERKLNLNHLLEDAVKEVAAARTLLAGGPTEAEKEEDTDGRKPREVIEKAEAAARKIASAEETVEEKKKGDEEEIEIDEDSVEYFQLKLMLEKAREIADLADGIDPFARQLFDTPDGLLDAIVDWFDDEPPSTSGEFERSGPVETIGELALLEGIPRQLLNGYPEEEIRVKPKEGELELELIDPWAKKPFPGLRGYLTVYGDGLVNINTAPREVLEVVLQDNNDDQSILAADIIAAREELPFAKVENVNDDEYLTEKVLTKFMEKFKVTSEYFNILSEGRVGKEVDGKFTGISVRIRAVVQRQENRIVICYWRVED